MGGDGGRVKHHPGLGERPVPNGLSREVPAGLASKTLRAGAHWGSRVVVPGARDPVAGLCPGFRALSDHRSGSGSGGLGDRASGRRTWVALAPAQPCS